MVHIESFAPLESVLSAKYHYAFNHMTVSLNGMIVGLRKLEKHGWQGHRSKCTKGVRKAVQFLRERQVKARLLKDCPKVVYVFMN